MKNGKTEKNVKNSRFCQFWAQISGPQIFLRHEVGGSKLKLQSNSKKEGGVNGAFKHEPKTSLFSSLWGQSKQNIFPPKNNLLKGKYFLALSSI